MAAKSAPSMTRWTHAPRHNHGKQFVHPSAGKSPEPLGSSRFLATKHAASALASLIVAHLRALPVKLSDRLDSLPVPLNATITGPSSSGPEQTATARSLHDLIRSRMLYMRPLRCSRYCPGSIPVSSGPVIGHPFDPIHSRFSNPYFNQ